MKSDGSVPAPATEPSPDRPETLHRHAVSLGEPTRTSAPFTTVSPAPERPAVAEPTPQRRDPDRYQIIGEHGRGGLGRVSRAHDRELGRDVAIKELISRGDLSEVRFLREALITARLEHPGIVPVHEAGRWLDGTPFYAMKLVAGRPLRELIGERKTVDERVDLLHHVIAVADAIAYAHGRNIIHRDLKPANVIVGEFGETVVIDWGLAKDLTVSEDSGLGRGSGAAPIDRTSDLTSAGSVLGTPAYMAPEQARGDHVDQRADVFAIGAMLWELCALQKIPPTSVRVRHRILRTAGIDRDLITIIDKALEPDRDRRYPHAGALAADLKAFRSGARIAARRYSLPAMLAHWTRHHRALALSVIAALVVAAAGGVIYVRNVSSERDRANAERERADQALAVANTQTEAANVARDRAQLSEINTLLQRDPTRALDLLRHTADRTPQYAMLMSRATQRAAAHVFRPPDRVRRLQGAPDGAELAIETFGGALYLTTFESAANPRVTDPASVGPLVRGDGAWWYARRPFGGITSVVSSRGQRPAIETRGLLSEDESKLYYVDHTVLTLEPGGSLYRIDPSGPVRIASGIQRYATDGALQVICSIDQKLTVSRHGQTIATDRCAASGTSHGVAAAGGHYAALRDLSTILIDHRQIALPTPVSRSYELALSDSGVLAIADYAGGAWFVRPGSDQVEAGPRRAMSPLSAAADGELVVWGFQDGSVVALDTRTQDSWEFIGHPEGVSFLAIDRAHRWVASASRREIRIWELTPNPIKLNTVLPATAVILGPTGASAHLAMAATDGGARLWDPGANTVRDLHHHPDIATSMAMLGDQVCTGGWDGRVMCTSIDGARTATALEGPGRIYGLAAGANASCLFVAAADGKIWQLGDPQRPHSEISDRQRVLFAHTQFPSPFGLQASADGHWLASGSIDGSLVIYDLVADRVFARKLAHQGQLTTVHWDGPTLWTAGDDGMVKQWALLANDLEVRQRYPQADQLQFFKFIVGDHRLTIDTHGMEISAGHGEPALRLDLDKLVVDVKESEDHRYVAAITQEELIVIDRENHALTAVRPSVSSLSCLQFLHSAELVICGRNTLLTTDLHQLSYVPYAARPIVAP